jgi:cytochrome c oxidase cbb3-type subunit 3
MEKTLSKKLKSISFTKLFLFIALVLGYNSGWSQTASTASTTDYTLAYVLIMVMVLLLFIIWFLIKLLESSSDYFLEKWKKEQRESTGTVAKAIAFFAFTLTGLSSFAQTAATPQPVDTGLIGGLPTVLFYLMICVILVEFVVVMVLTWQVYRLVTAKKAYLESVNGQVVEPELTSEEKLSWWDKMNKFKPLESEADLDLGHDFDGIRELDNKLPPWWLYGFYLTIIVGVIYFYRFSIAHTGLSSAQEYAVAVEEAEKIKSASLKETASSVDETTITESKDAAHIAAGMATFKQLCSVCHGQKGEGLVGPNLTDEYWIYGGGIKDIFKTVKYGTNKGMQSWKDNLTPDKIAQVANYIRTLKGTNPPNPKAPDGVIYKEETAPATTATDTTKTDTTTIKK